MIQLIGSKCIKEYDRNDTKKGIIFTDSEYAELPFRKNGIIPGKGISSILINTAFRQSSIAYFVLSQTINELLTQHASGEYSSNMLDTDATFYSTGIRLFIEYLNNINNIISGAIEIFSSRATTTALNYTTASVPKSIEDEVIYYKKSWIQLKDDILNTDKYAAGMVNNYVRQGTIYNKFREFQKKLQDIRLNYFI